MPKLRNISAVAQMLLQQRMRQRNAEYEDNLINERQTGQAHLQDRLERERLAIQNKNNLGLKAATDWRLARQLQEQYPEFAAYVPTSDQVAADVGREVASVSERPKLHGNLDFEPLLASKGGVDAAKDPRVIEQLMAQRDGRRRMIDLAQESDLNNDAVKSYNTRYQTDVAANDAANATLPDTIRRTNEQETGTRGERVTSAGQISFAQGAGNARGGLQPDIVDSRVNQAERIAQAETAARVTNAPMNATEANRAALWQRMVSSSMDAATMESKPGFKGLGPGVRAAVAHPSFGTVLDFIGQFDDSEKLYAQQVADFGGSALFLMSGAATTPAEYTRIAWNLFAVDTDGPQQIKAKQQRRSTLVQANQLAMNKGRTEAGYSLGRAIRSGTMGTDLGFTLDPEVQQGINDVLSGKVQ